MIAAVLRLLLALLQPAAGAEGLRQTAPRYLTLEAAREHLIAAQLAAAAADVDRDVLLSIAHHESRYLVGATTAEAGGKVSCGVMTPEPTHDRAACAAARASAFSGYLAGALHLRGWLRACRGNETCALRGYAGGFALIRACRSGPVTIRPGVDACLTPSVFLSRARWISRSISRSAAPPPAPPAS